MRNRTIADLGVGPRVTINDRVASLKPAITEEQKCLLAIPAGMLLTYFGLGLIRCLLILNTDTSAILIPFVDWWWILLFR